MMLRVESRQPRKILATPDRGCCSTLMALLATLMVLLATLMVLQRINGVAAILMVLLATFPSSTRRGGRDIHRCREASLVERPGWSRMASLVLQSPSMSPPRAGKHNVAFKKQFRKDLRNSLTPAEAALWLSLKKRQLDGK